MKVLLLDIDGVLAVNSCYNKSRDNKWGVYKFDEKCVSVLNFIIQETNCEIVLSSDWRTHYTLQEMREIFAFNHVIRTPISFTSRSKKYNGGSLEFGRSEEINAWVENHIWKNDSNWIAVDDLNMDEWLHPNFVLCANGNEGIKQTGVKEKIIEKLNKTIYQ